MALPEYYRVVEHLSEDSGEPFAAQWCMFHHRIVSSHFAKVNEDTHRCVPLTDEEVVIAGLEGKLPP